MAEEQRTYTLPVLPLRDVVIFPGVFQGVGVGRRRSVAAVKQAVDTLQEILVLSQRRPDVEECTPEDVYLVGTLCRCHQVATTAEGTMHLGLEGLQRMRVLRFLQQEPMMTAEAVPIAEPDLGAEEHSVQAQALLRTVVTQFGRAAELSAQLGGNIPPFAVEQVNRAGRTGRVADLVAFHLSSQLEEKQDVLETLHPLERLQKVVGLLARELDVREAERDIRSRTFKSIHDTQREAFLREQLRVIEEELAGEGHASEDEEYRKKVDAAGMPEEVKEKADKELSRLRRTPSISPEHVVLRNYLDWLVGMPWSQRTEDNLNIDEAERILEEDHHALQKAKERVLEFLAVRMLAGADVKTPILCFVGPPGVGKTSIGRSIARALGRKFIRLSLGGMRDEAEIRGHRRTYVGALPGRVLQTISRAKSKNPVFMIDEIDKLGMDFRGDPSAALLEVLDPEQNHEFTDHYLEVPFDLSEVLFIATANMVEPVIPALKDRMEVIEFPGYIEDEKLRIGERFLVRKQLKASGLKARQVVFEEGALSKMSREYTREAGVRNLERKIGEVCRKVARERAAGRKKKVVVTADNVHEFLGPPKYHYGMAEKADEVGVATGLGWTESGGDLLPIEVILVEGKGELVLTGRLGEVMKESGQAALTCARRLLGQLQDGKRRLDKTDIHIHAPSGAIPKEGPSAGITMATAIISALTGIPVRRDVAMTGEVTLRGKVLPIGAVKEKVLAAHRAGILTVILPSENEKDLVEIPDYAKKDLTFRFVDRMESVLEQALTQALKLPKRKPPRPRRKPAPAD